MDHVELEVAYKALKVKYVGPEAFLRDGFVKMCQDIAALDVPDNEAQADEAKQRSPSDGRPSTKSRKSTTDFAVALSASTGPDLALAAAAFLFFTEGKEDLKRAEILEAMKMAKSFYKSTYSGNLSSILTGMVKKGKLTNPGNEVYALAHAEIEALKSYVD